MPSSSFQYRPDYYIQVSDLSGTEEITVLYSPSGYGYEWQKKCKTIAGAKRACTKHYQETKAAFIAGLDEFTRAYVAAAMWDDNRDIYDMSLSALQEMSSDCAKFQADNAELLAQAYERYIPREGYSGQSLAGHDFWLTRNGHGVGFWDRKELETDDEGNPDNVADDLTTGAEAFGECNLYVGNDKQIYCD